VVNKVKIAQKTKKVLRILNIINRLRNQVQLVAITNEMHGEGETTPLGARREHAPSGWEEKMNPRRRHEIEQIFDFFDADKSRS